MPAAVKSRSASGPATCHSMSALKLQQRKDKLAERILTEADVHRMLALEPGRRNQVLLRLLYIAGLRVSEIVDLKWRDLELRTDGGQGDCVRQGIEDQGRAAAQHHLARAAPPAAKGGQAVTPLGDRLTSNIAGSAVTAFPVARWRRSPPGPSRRDRPRG